MNRLLATAVLVGLAVPSPSAPSANEIPDPRQEDLKGEDRLAVLVERVRFEHDRLDTLEARFTQLKESELLSEPIEAHGVFSFAAPDRVRWEYLEPDPISMLIQGDVMTTWYKDIAQAEKIYVGKQSQRVLEYLGASSSVSRLLEYFDVRLRTPKDLSKPFHLELKPRFARVERRVREMEIWIHPDHYLPIKLRYVEGNGDLTVYDFTDLRVNSTLPDDRFDLEIPDEVDLREVDLSRRAASLK